MGVGRKLFEKAVTIARGYGAKKLYISAHSSKEFPIDTWSENEYELNKTYIPSERHAFSDFDLGRNTPLK